LPSKLLIILTNIIRDTQQEALQLENVKSFLLNGLGQHGLNFTLNIRRQLLIPSAALV
jgi:hypothetical protein